MKRIRHHIWQVLHSERDTGKSALIINWALVILILLNVFAVIEETIPHVSRRYGSLLWRFEIFSVAVFSIEYLLRLWTAVEEDRFRRPVLGRLRYALTFLAVVDLLSILPFYLPWMGVDLLPLRLFRLVRLIRVLKLERYSQSLQLIGRVMKNKKGDLVSAAVLAVVLLLISATLLHAVEAPEQPERFGTMPDCMWWAVITMTTVGYGDVYPRTVLGKLIGSSVAFLGIGMFAMPAGILGAGFLEARTEKHQGRRRDGIRCPHCGGLLEDGRIDNSR